MKARIDYSKLGSVAEALRTAIPLKNAPGHNHLIPGYWDNASSQRKTCDVCVKWTREGGA